MDERRAARPGPGRFRNRLTAAFVLVAAVSSGVLAVATLTLSHGYRWRSFRAAAQSEATLALALAPSQLDEQSFVRLRRAYEANVGTDMVATNGSLTFSSSESISLADLPLDELGEADGDPLPALSSRVRGRSYLVVAGDGPGSVRYYFLFSAEQVEASLDELLAILAIGWAVTVVAAAGVGHLIARRTLRPVRQAAEASTALAAGLLETRLDPAGKDEFGVWATAFNRMADALADKIGALAAAAERERRFTSDVAHELRTPLTGMAATASLLEDELAGLPDGPRRPAGLMVKEVRRLRDLVLELLELSRLDSGSEPTHLEELQVKPSVDAVLESLDGQVTAPLVVDVEPGLAVLADRTRLRRVLTNLVCNAAVHGGGPIEVTARRENDGVTLEVADHGPGIDPEDLPHIFDRFFKSDRSRASGGSGLGLAIADHHARALGGPLAVRNRPDGGAVFSLRLHLAPDDPGPPEPPK